MTKFTFSLASGAPPKEVTILIPGGGPARTIPGARSLTIAPQPGQPVPAFITFAADEGHWALTVATTHLTASQMHLVFPVLKGSRKSPWWHDLHISTPQARPGEGIRIGVIDEALAQQGASSCIQHIRNEGGAGYGRAKSARAYSPMTDHGQAVCALLGSRASNGHGYGGIAPFAEIIFASAADDRSPLLRASRVESCIAYLSEQMECDLISVSAGDSRIALPGIEQAVEEAADLGTLCFFAAGNEGVPQYPAVYPSCLAVAALGHSGHAPAGTEIEHLDAHESHALTGAREYLWRRSAHGPAVEFCAGGVGVIWNRDGKAARAAFGTSFASPLAVGAAALILAKHSAFRQAPRDRTRYRVALQQLQRSCKPLGTLSELSYWKYGRLWV